MLISDYDICNFGEIPINSIELGFHASALTTKITFGIWMLTVCVY
jgi:hypothetical protein